MLRAIPTKVSVAVKPKRYMMNTAMSEAVLSTGLSQTNKH